MLPKNIELTSKDLPDEMLDKLMDYMDDYLSEKYGYLIRGYDLGIKIEANNIDWDTED